MKKHNKIHWERGLYITSEVLINSDSYHIAERNLLGRFVAFPLYGILSGGKFDIENIDTGTLRINISKCLAVTHDGYVINIEEDTPFSREVNLERWNKNEKELYVVLTVNPYSTVPVECEELEFQTCPAEYNLELTRKGETFENGIPVLKINKDDSGWEIDNEYIPPSISLNSLNALKQQYLKIRENLNDVIEKLENDPIYIQVMLFYLELDNYDLQESPKELALLLKKICWMLKSAKKIKELPIVERFVEKKYNHDEIGEILHYGVKCLEEIYQELSKEPSIQPKKEEVVVIENGYIVY